MVIDASCTKPRRLVASYSANEYAPLPLEPGKEPFDKPAMLITP